jgi:hypothetical protein
MAGPEYGHPDRLRLHLGKYRPTTDIHA